MDLSSNLRISDDDFEFIGIDCERAVDGSMLYRDNPRKLEQDKAGTKHGDLLSFHEATKILIERMAKKDIIATPREGYMHYELKGTPSKSPQSLLACKLLLMRRQAKRRLQAHHEAEQKRVANIPNCEKDVVTSEQGKDGWVDVSLDVPFEEWHGDWLIVEKEY